MFEITVRRDQWTPQFHHYEQRWNDLTPTEARLAWIVKNEIKENYLTEGGHVGIPWQQRTRPYPHPPLRKTATMLRQQYAMAVQPWDKQRSNVKRLDFSHIALEATPWSRFHAEGTTHMPQRRTVIFTEQARDEMHEVIADHVFSFSF